MGSTKCEVCQENNHKYKCPRCLLKYCSVPCFKKHKDAQCKNEGVTQDSAPPVRNVEERVPGVYDRPAVEPVHGQEDADRVPEERLKVLGKSEVLLGMLDNPHLQDMVLRVDSTDTPEKDVHKAMLEPIFAEFADECLKVIEPEKHDHLQWQNS